jgi:hypothetical protein
MAPLSLADIEDDAGLAVNIGGTVERLVEFSDPARQRGLYQQLRLRKRNPRREGEARIVYKARQPLALVQKNVAEALSAHTHFAPCVQGFVPGRSIVTNATLHLAQREILHADIEDFFDSITVERVERAFLSVGCRPSIAARLARVCTLEGRLPQGSSASPVIANLVCQGLDAAFQQLANASKCRYSRYADDITISGAKVPDATVVASMVAREGFTLNRGKFRIQRIGRCQYVTGLTVFDRLGPHVGRAIKRNLRQQLYYAQRFGLENHLARISSSEDPLHVLNRWHGWVAFMKSVERNKAADLHRRWLIVNRAFWDRANDSD